MKCCVLTDVGTWTNWLTFKPDPDYSPDAGTGLLFPISYALQRRFLLHWENPKYRYWASVAADAWFQNGFIHREQPWEPFYLRYMRSTKCLSSKNVELTKHQLTVVCIGCRDNKEAPPIDDALGTGLNCLFSRCVGLFLACRNSAAGAVLLIPSFGRNCDGSICHNNLSLFFSWTSMKMYKSQILYWCELNYGKLITNIFDHKMSTNLTKQISNRFPVFSKRHFNTIPVGFHVISDCCLLHDNVWTVFNAACGENGISVNDAFPVIT